MVGYFGLIRGEATFALITRLAERLQGRVLFRFGGILTTVDQAKFDAVLRRCPNIVYRGPYLPHQDLEDLYRDVDFTWALDLEHTDHNSRWLMPCRFYESGYFGIPCLAVHGFEVGNTIERHRIGWTFDAPLEESLIRFFEQLTPAAYEHIRGRLRSVSTHHVRGRRGRRRALRDPRLGQRYAGAPATARLIMTQSNSTSRSALSRLTG